jgi:hypothetical protein
MTTLRETFAADFEEEERLASEASKESTEEQDFAEDKDLQEYIKTETAKMESEIQATEELQKKMLGKIVISNSKYRRARIPEVHFTTKDIDNSEPVKVSRNISKHSVIGKMIANNKQVKIDKIKSGFSANPRVGLARRKRRWMHYKYVK